MASTSTVTSSATTLAATPPDWGPDAGVRPAGAEAPVPEDDAVVDTEPLPGGVRWSERGPAPIEALSDEALGARFTALSNLDGPLAAGLLDEVVEEMASRLIRTVGPAGSSPTRPANTMVTPEIGLAILSNIADGKPPFKPELGKGQASWFVVEGDPYVGPLVGKDVPVRVEIVRPTASVVLGEAELSQMLAEKIAETAPEARAEMLRRFGLPDEAALNNRQNKALRKLGRGMAESRMWDEVGRLAGRTRDGVVEVVLEPGSQFSRQGPGRFVVVSKPEVIQLKDGLPGLVEAVEAAGAETPAHLRAAADAFATRMKWAGRVRAAFHYGGRVLLVVGVAADAYQVAVAKDKTKALLTSAGGWAGAWAAGSGFAGAFAPADTAGPVAWAIHGVGSLVAGSCGYWLGSESVRYTYELVEPDEP